MATEIFELPQINSTETGERESITRRYKITLDRSATIVTNESEYSVIKQFVKDHTPFTYETFPRSEITLNERGGDVWEARVRYEATSAEEPGPLDPDDDGPTRLSFSVTAEQHHITHAELLQTFQGNFPEQEDDYGGAINVQLPQNGLPQIDGLDIVVPSLRLTLTKSWPASQFDDSLVESIFNATGKVNSTLFRGFAPGQVLFLGATAGELQNGRSDVSYEFSCLPNRVNVQIGSVADGVLVGQVDGWDYLSPVTWTNLNQNSLRAVVVQVDVIRVYDRINFSALRV